MFKKTMLMASLAIAAIAFAVPAVASAEKWADGTVALSAGQNPQISVAGPASFTGSLGGTSCNQTTGTAQLTGNTGTAHVTNFAVDNPNGCTTQGALAFCTLQSVTFEGTSGSNWTAHNSGTSDISITKVEFQNHYSGFCPTPTLQLHGEITITPDSGQTHALHQGQLSGTLQGTSGQTGCSSCNLGTVTASGSGTVTPAGTYGLT